MEVIVKQEAGVAQLTDELSVTQALTHAHPTMQMLLTSKPLLHRPEAGLNPLVDAGAYLFSIMGKLKHIKSYKRLDKLHAELIEEIKNFQETIETYHNNAKFLAEYVPISCYAVCSTLDDIIKSTTWGGQGKWEKYNLVNTFNQAHLSQESFLIILERLVYDPVIYIDMMEFIYICLSLGFKCHYSDISPLAHEQLERIIISLYQRIRAYRGTINKTLSPTPRNLPKKTIVKKQVIPSWLIILSISSVFVTLFMLGKYLLKQF